MKDIQNLADSRRIDIKKVGVKKVNYPISLRDKLNSRQYTIASANMYVNLPHQFKGTHMSRFVEILNDFYGDFDIGKFPQVLERMKERLEAQASHLELTFPFFYGGERGKRCYQCKLSGSLTEKPELHFTVDIPISSPRFTSDDNRRQLFGSWGVAEVCVRFQRFFWIEDLIKEVEDAVASLAAGTKDGAEAFCAEALCRTIGRDLEKIAELRLFSVIIRHFESSCSTFAHLEGSVKR